MKNIKEKEKKINRKKSKLTLLSLSILSLTSLSAVITSSFAFYGSASFARIADFGINMIKPAAVSLRFNGTNDNNDYLTQEELDKGFYNFLSTYVNEDNEIAFDAVSSAFSKVKWLKDEAKADDYQSVTPRFVMNYSSTNFKDYTLNDTPMFIPNDDYLNTHLTIPLLITEKDQASMPVHLYFGKKTTFNLNENDRQKSGLAQAMRISVLCENGYYIINPYTPDGVEFSPSGYPVAGPLDIDQTREDAGYLDTYPENYFNSLYGLLGSDKSRWADHEALFGDYRMIMDGKEIIPNDFFNEYKNVHGKLINEDGSYKDIVVGDVIQYFAYSPAPMEKDTESVLSNGTVAGLTKKGNYQLKLKDTLSKKSTIKIDGDENTHTIGVKLLYEKDETTNGELLSLEDARKEIELCYLKPGESRKVYISYYFEGWDRSDQEGWSSADLENLGDFTSTIEISGRYAATSEFTSSVKE